jgi:hypothetical protein
MWFMVSRAVEKNKIMRHVALIEIRDCVDNCVVGKSCGADWLCLDMRQLTDVCGFHHPVELIIGGDRR